MENSHYAPEEILSFDRMKRAVVSRIVETASRQMEAGVPLDRDKLLEMATDEWKAAKDFVRFSFNSTGKLREYARQQVSQLVQDMIEADRAELEALGVRDTVI